MAFKEMTAQYWRRLPENRSGALLNSLIRILFAPVFIFLEIASLKHRLVEDEDYECARGGTVTERMPPLSEDHSDSLIR